MLTVQKWYKLLSRDPDCCILDNSYQVNNTDSDINEEKLVRLKDFQTELPVKNLRSFTKRNIIPTKNGNNSD